MTDRIKSVTSSEGIRLVCMSDLHAIKGSYPVPEGDVLIIAGDVCNSGDPEELKEFDSFLKSLTHKHKLLIAGNHDFPFALAGPRYAQSLVKNALYLENSGIEIAGLKFWGTPWQPAFCNMAFNLPRGPLLAAIWNKISDETDVLITHTPPYGILDKTYRGEHVGCKDLAAALRRVQPKVHVFGHIHEDYGIFKQDGTIYVNASLRNEYFQLVNEPIVIDL